MEQRKLSDQANMLVDLSKVCEEGRRSFLPPQFPRGQAPMSKPLGHHTRTLPQGLGVDFGLETDSNPSLMGPRERDGPFN